MTNLKVLLCSRRKRKGFVLISVLMLGVLLISCATSFTWFVRQQVRTVGSERLTLAGRSMAQILVNEITTLLSEMSEHIGYDSPLQKWYQPFVVSIDGLGIWLIRITPLDDKIPIRSLFLPDGNTLRRELNDIWAEMWEKLGHRELEQVVLDFFDRNTRTRVGSVEREEFINRPPFDLSELLIISNDITPEILYGSGGRPGIEHYCTIYSDGRINLNTAPLQVLELLPGLDTGGLAASVVKARSEKPLETLEDVQNIPGASPKTSTQLTNIAAFKSRYIQIKIDCLDELGTGNMAFTIIVDRTTKQIVRWEEI